MATTAIRGQEAAMADETISVYWQPGCSSCLRTKEFLTEHGVPFRSVDVLADPQGFRELQALGVRMIPLVVKGREWVSGQILTDVARIVAKHHQGSAHIAQFVRAVRRQRCIQLPARHRKHRIRHLLQPCDDVALHEEPHNEYRHHQTEERDADQPEAGIVQRALGGRGRLGSGCLDLRDQGRTILVTSQYVGEAEHCDRIAVLGRGRLIATGTPRAIRRAAMGGDVIVVQAPALDQAMVEALEALPGVRAAQWIADGQARLTVDDARVAIPRVLEALRARGVSVTRVQQHQASFDEVFVRLMEREGVASGE